MSCCLVACLRLNLPPCPSLFACRCLCVCFLSIIHPCLLYLPSQPSSSLPHPHRLSLQWFLPLQVKCIVGISVSISYNLQRAAHSRHFIAFALFHVSLSLSPTCLPFPLFPSTPPLLHLLPSYNPLAFHCHHLKMRLPCQALVYHRGCFTLSFSPSPHLLVMWALP